MSTDILEKEVELTDLVTIPKTDALTVFATEFKDGETHPILPILAKVRDVIDAFEPDLSTATSRKKIASMARRVASAKTALESVGKDLADEQKEIPKRIDATRKFIKYTLDKWRDEVRQPLTDWEDAEQKRTDAIKATLAEWQNLAADQTERPSELIRERLAEMEREAVTEERFAEFLSAAEELKASAIAHLTDQLARAEKREAEAAELEELRKEKAERDARDKAEKEAREAKEREEEIARRAEENARKAAEAEAQAKIDAAEKALRDEREKLERERQEAAAKAKREAEEQAAREADREHRRRINTAALDAFMQNGIDRETAITVITLIGEGNIPAIKIHY